MPDALQQVLDGIKNAIDDPSIIYNLHSKIGKFPSLSTGIAKIDSMLEGGLPQGKIVEIFGGEASGKTTFMLHCVAAAQARGEVVFFIDAECALDPNYAQRIGVDVKSMLFAQPDYGEQALNVMIVICDQITKYNEANKDKPLRALVVLDSVAALVSKQALTAFEKDGVDATVAMAATPRMLSSKLPYVCHRAAAAGVTCVFINQMRDKVGVTYGPTTTTPGGRALKFFSSLRLQVARVGNRKQGETVVAQKSKVTPVKSKQFPIHNKYVEFYINENGIDWIASLVEEALARGLIAKSGTWLKFADKKIQGAANMEQAIRDDFDLLSKLVDLLDKSHEDTAPVMEEPKPAPKKPGVKSMATLTKKKS
jgi:recombination protein RecA